MKLFNRRLLIPVLIIFLIILLWAAPCWVGVVAISSWLKALVLKLKKLSDFPARNALRSKAGVAQLGAIELLK